MWKSRHAYVRIRRSRACTFQVWLSPGGVVYARIRFESKMVMFGDTVGLYKHVITNNQLISRAYYCVNFSTRCLLEGWRKYSISIVNNHLLQRDSFCGSPDWFHPIKYWKYEFMHWISTWAVSIIDFPLSLVRVWNKAHPSWKNISIIDLDNQSCRPPKARRPMWELWYFAHQWLTVVTRPSWCPGWHHF